MAKKTRVSHLARELGLPSKQILEDLGRLGEYVKSASSVIEAPTVRRVYELYPDRRPDSAPSQPPNPPASLSKPAEVVRPDPGPRPIPPLPTRPRGPHRGAEPTGHRRALLDRYIVPSSQSVRRPYSPARYWAEEVADADFILREWGDAVFAGMVPNELVDWIEALTEVSVAHAIALRAAGVLPFEVTASTEDGYGQAGLNDRLVMRRLTVEDVVDEVFKRRLRRGA